MKTKLIGAVALMLAGGLVVSQTSSAQDKPKESQTKKMSGSGSGSTSGSSSKKSDLELALEEALKNNPDLRVAVAKAAEADAQLSRARAQVVQKVVAAWQAIDAAKAKLGEAERRRDTMARLRNKISGGVTDNDFFAAQASAAEAKATLATAESELEYLTGKGKTAEKYHGQLSTYYRQQRLSERQKESTAERRALEDWLKATPSKGPAAERIRKALEKKTRFTFKATSARDVLKSIQGDAERSGIHVQANTKGEAWDEKVTATFDDVPLSTVLQLLEDALGDHRVVVRDYGLLIAPQGKLPPNAVTLGEFLKTKAATAEPAVKIHGKVTGIEKDMIRLSIGADAGLKKGDVLEVYRLGNKPQYVGKIKVIEVQPKAAVGEVMGKLASRIEVGDEVGNVAPDAK